MEHILMDYLRVSQHLSRRLRIHFGKLNLTFPQALTLSVLRKEGGMPISKLAERIDSANSTVSGIMDRLERLDLARRIRSERDRRIIYVEVTPRYETLCRQMEADVYEYFENLLGTLSPEERESIAQSVRLLDRVLLQNKGRSNMTEKGM